MPEFTQERHEKGLTDLPTEFFKGKVVTEAWGGDTARSNGRENRERDSG